LRRFTTRLAMAALAIGGGYWAARTLAPSNQPGPSPPGQGGPAVAGLVGADAVSSSQAASTADPVLEASASGDGEKLILTVLETLERRPNIAAKVRQSMRVGSDRLTGEGEFWQQGVGNQRRTRWELKTVLAGDTAFVTQVCDGDHVWTDRKLPGDRRTTRIDVGRVRRELAAAASSAEQGRAPLGTAPELLARGGLSQLLADLHRCFAFGPEQTLRRGDHTVKAVIGLWRPEQLERAWPGLSTGASEWPPHLPHHVLLYVDNDDLFPYLVEYRGGAQAELATSSAAYFPAQEALAGFEFIDVQFAATMPSSLFEFTPAESDWHDVTARVIDELRPPAPKPEETASSHRSGTWR
jgi:hypothetical protein